MKKLTTIKAWILICLIIVVSNAATEHASSHHDLSHHGDSLPQKKYQNTIVPVGIQIPEQVLSTQDVACISADSNIFEIMNKAQESCNGTDMRCTFYHFVNHGYQNIGTLDIDKDLFDDLLMKYDNWLLTAENMEKNDVPLEVKTKEDSFLDTESIEVNGSYSNEEPIENSSNVSETERLYTNQGVHIDKVDHNTNESDDHKKVKPHHIKNLYDTHHKNHHHKLKNGNHIKLVPEYNKDHRYFEVFLPKDKETGKPRTIYVEIDKDKNEFVLLDEEIDKKLNGIKPIRIELDELSEIADTAFNGIAKSSNNKHHIYDSNNDDRIMTSGLNTYSEINEDTTNLDIDIGESTQNYLSPSICNIHSNQQLIPDNMTGNVTKIINATKNLVVPNKYINQAKFCAESQIYNTTDEIQNDHLEFLESSNNETDTYETGFSLLDTFEFNENNTNVDLDLDNTEYFPENFDILCDDNSTETYELSTEHDNVTFYDDYFEHLEENNDTFIDIDFDDTHDLSSSETTYLNKSHLQTEEPVQRNNLKTTPNIYKPKLTSSQTAGISDDSSPQLEGISSENRQGQADLHDHFPEPGIPLSPYITVPLLGKDLAKVLETDSHLQSSFPVYATLDLPAGASQNNPPNVDFEYPRISSDNCPLNSDFGHESLRPKKLRLPCAVGPLSQESILKIPVQKNKELTDSIYPEPPSLDHTIPVEDSRLFQTVPSLNVDIQEPSLTSESYNLETNGPVLPKNVLPSKLDLPKIITDLDEISTTCQLSGTPLSVMPSLKDAVYSPCLKQQIPSYLQQIKPNQDLGLNKYSPFDNNSIETMIPCAANKNRYPYTTIPYFLNPYLKPPQLIPPCLEPLLPVTPLQTASKIPTFDSSPISSDQSNLYVNREYPQEMIPTLPLPPNIQFSPLNPLGPGYVPNTLLPCQNLWNNIPYHNIPSLPYTALPDHNIRNYQPIVNNHLTPPGLQQNQILKPLLSKSVPLLVPEQPCPVTDILEITPSSYTPFLSPVPMDLNPSLSLERDLQSLSLKYGIPLAKILNALETEMSDVHNKTDSPNLEVTYSDLGHDSSLKKKLALSNKKAALGDENRSVYKESLLESDLSDLVPLDSSLIGPGLETESSLMLDTNNSQSHTVSSEILVPSILHDSSLIGPHLSTSTTSNFELSDDIHNTNEVVVSKSNSSKLKPLDSSLIGPHLEIGSPPIVLDSNNSHSNFLASHTDVPITISSPIDPKLHIQNQPTNLVLDSSLIGSHLPSLSPVKPLLSDKIGNIFDMISLEADLTDLTPLDSSVIHIQEDLVNQLDQTEILTISEAIPSTKLPPEYLSKKLVDEELHLESDSLLPLDSSLIGPELKLGSSPIMTDPLGDKTIPLVSKESLQNTDNKIEELGSIILPSSLLPKLLNMPVKADPNLNIGTQETKSNAEFDELSRDTYVELPLTDISQISFKDTEIKSVETIPELPSLTDDRNIALLTKDSKTSKHKSKLSDITHVVYSETPLDSSITGTSILHKLDNPENSPSLDSSIHLDSSLIGPSILQEIDSREISPILDSESSLTTTTIDQNKKPSEILTVIDSSIELESSLKGPTILHEINSKETSTAFESLTQFENSSMPSLHETKESSATTSVLKSSQLDSSLIGPSLLQETLEVSHAFNSKDILDNSLVGPHLLTDVPFSSDEIKIINEELQSELDHVNLIPLDSSLTCPHVDFERELEESEIFSSPEVSETTDFIPTNLVEGILPLEPTYVSPICTSDHQELFSKFTNAITKSQLSPSELKPCENLLSSIAKISDDNINISPPCNDLQTLTLNTLLNTPLSLQDELASEFSPTTMIFPAQEFSPGESLAIGLDSNYHPTPKTFAESLAYSQGVPHIPTTPCSLPVQMKPSIDRYWLGPNNIQNILQSSPSFRPVVGNTPAPFISNALPLTSEDLKSILDLANYSKLYPQLTIPNMFTSGDAIAPSIEWTTPSKILPLNEYIFSLPKNNSSVLPSNSESTISDSEYNPIVVDDIISHLDENSSQLLKDMSILPFSQSSLSPTIPVFEKGEFVAPALLETMPTLDSDFIQTKPLLPIPIMNPLVPSSTYNTQHVPFMKPTQNISPCNLQPYFNIPLHSQFPEITGPFPKIVSLPAESSKVVLQQLLSKPCVESPIILPITSLDTMLQLPTPCNELNSVPRQLPVEYFTPISPIYTTPLSNEFASPMLPMYAKPLSVYYAQPISTPSTSSALNVPYIDSPLTILPLVNNPYAAKPLSTKYSSPVMPLKITPTSDYPYPPTVEYNKPIPLEIPYKPSQTYSSPYLPTHASPIPIDTSSGSQNIISKLPAATTSLMSPVFHEHLSVPCVIPLPKSLTSSGLSVYSGPLAPISLGTLTPTPTSLLSPAYLSPANSYPSVPVPINTQTQPSNLLKPVYTTPISPLSSSLSLYNTPLSLNPLSSPNPKIKSELQALKLLNTSPFSNAVNPFLNSNQRLPINSNTLPIQNYGTHVPISNFNTQIKQNIPCEDALESNLLTSALTEEIPSYDVIEESAYTYSNDKDETYYEEPTLKYPLESLSYTLAPEEIAETLPSEDFIKLEDLTPSAPESSRQTKSSQHHHITPCTPLNYKPVLKPRPAPELLQPPVINIALQPPSLTETIPQNIHDNTPLVPSSPLKHPVSLPTSILSNPFLKPLSPLTFTPIHTSLSPYNKLPLNEKLVLSTSPYYSAPRQDMSSPPIFINSQATPAFSQVPTNAPIVTGASPMSLPKLQPTASPSILDDYIKLPSTHFETKSKTLTSPVSLMKQLPTPSYTQFAAPIISHISPLEMPITSQYISALISSPQSLKNTKPFISPKLSSSILPTQTTLQGSSPLKEAPIHYQPYISPPTRPTSSTNNMFESPPDTSTHAVLPSVNIVEPVITDLNRPQSQYSLPSSSLPVSKYSPIVSYSNLPYSRISPQIPKQASTNHIIPSSLFMSSDTDFQKPKNKLSSLYNILNYSSPSSFIAEPLDTVPYYTPNRHLKNILKLKSPLSSAHYTIPSSSSPYLTQHLEPTDCIPTQLLNNVEYTNKPHPKLSTVSAQYASSSLSPMYTSVPLGSGPKQLMNIPSAPQYSQPRVSVYDSQIHSSPSDRNPFLNQDFKPIIELPSYPVPKNIVSSSVLAPFESILLSNLRPQDISPESQNLHSSPIIYSTPLPPSSLLKPLAKGLPQISSQYQPHINSNNPQYVFQSPINNAPQILPSTSPLLKSPLLQPLLTNSQSNAPLVSMHFSNTKTAFPEGFSTETVPSVTSPDIALSIYLPSDSSNKYSGPYDSLVSEIPEIVSPINTSPTTPYISPTPLNKHFQSPLNTPTNMPLYSNYDILEPSRELSIKANTVNTDKPIAMSAICASELAPLSLVLDTETIDKTEPYDLIPDFKNKFPPLALGVNQQRQLHPAFTSKYLAMPRPIKTLPSSKYKTSKPRSSLPEEAELIDTTDLIPLSQIKSEPLIADYTPSERKAPITNTLSNIPESDFVQLPPSTTLLNTEFPPPTYKQLAPKLQTPCYSNQILQPSPTYLSPQECKDLTQGLSPSQASLPSPILSSTNIDPQLSTSLLTEGSNPRIPLYTNSMSIIPKNWLQSPIFAKPLPIKEKLIKITPEKEYTQTLLNQYRPAYKMTPHGNNHPYEPKSTTTEVNSKFYFIKPMNPLFKPKEPYTEYIEDFKSNDDNEYVPESDNASLDENKPNVYEAKPIKNLPRIMKGLSIPNYIQMAQIPQQLPKLDHFYDNNHIGKSPQIFNVPTSPIVAPADVASPYITMKPEILKDLSVIPTKHFGSVCKLVTTSHGPSEYYPEIIESPENVPITNSYTQNYLSPCLKYSSQTKSPLNEIEIEDTAEMNPISNTPYNNIDDIKYSGYKTYQIPSINYPQTPKNLGTPTGLFTPPVLSYSSPVPVVKPSNVQQTPSLLNSNFNSPIEISDPLIPQYQTPIKMTTPLQTKLGPDSLQESPGLNEYNPIEDTPKTVNSINEDNELKTSLINYINTREDVKNNLFNNNAELTIPIGNIAITKKEPYNSNTIETNNPSIGLKVWKSNVKIAQAELILKFKDLSVNNFMPIVNNLDKYDMEEIRKIVKNYIDEKYGNHIEISEPYTIDNKYTVIKDFDPNVVDSKYNLLWPTNYV